MVIMLEQQLAHAAEPRTGARHADDQLNGQNLLDWFVQQDGALVLGALQKLGTPVLTRVVWGAGHSVRAAMQQWTQTPRASRVTFDQKGWPAQNAILGERAICFETWPRRAVQALELGSVG
jgi:hypothetical protein